MLCVILICACGIGTDGPIIGEWQAVKEIDKIKDAKIDTTAVKISDFLYDRLNFKTAKTLEITRNAETLVYDYSISEGVLQFMANGKTTHFNIEEISQDSLVLYREENWANTIRISSTLYFTRIRKQNHSLSVVFACFA